VASIRPIYPGDHNIDINHGACEPLHVGSLRPAGAPARAGRCQVAGTRRRKEVGDALTRPTDRATIRSIAIPGTRVGASASRPGVPECDQS
jgi:hypothetical protein